MSARIPLKRIALEQLRQQMNQLQFCPKAYEKLYNRVDDVPYIGDDFSMKTAIHFSETPNIEAYKNDDFSDLFRHVNCCGVTDSLDKFMWQSLTFSRFQIILDLKYNPRERYLSINTWFYVSDRVDSRITQYPWEHFEIHHRVYLDDYVDSRDTSQLDESAQEIVKQLEEQFAHFDCCPYVYWDMYDSILENLQTGESFQIEKTYYDNELLDLIHYVRKDRMFINEGENEIVLYYSVSYQAQEQIFRINTYLELSSDVLDYYHNYDWEQFEIHGKLQLKKER